MVSRGERSSFEGGPVHIPVMPAEVMELLEPRTGGVYVDATVGAGGHSEEILRRIGTGGRLLCLDRDEEALLMASKRLSDERCVFMKSRFSELRNVAAEAGFEPADGVLLDFGVSLMQLKTEERGFSLLSDEPLDMRMDSSSGKTASDVVNSYSRQRLEEIIREYGEERRARSIARAIDERRRSRGPITTCRELAGLVAAVIGRGGRIHPATRTFQALRIEVNDELGEISRGLEEAKALLGKHGRLVTLAYHSLEDRIAKRFMKEADKAGEMRVLTKKPMTPAPEERRLNPASRSAKLRGAEKI